jgi:hypothetical protein
MDDNDISPSTMAGVILLILAAAFIMWSRH